jgi:hypothetical protein
MADAAPTDPVESHTTDNVQWLAKQDVAFLEDHLKFIKQQKSVFMGAILRGEHVVRMQEFYNTAHQDQLLVEYVIRFKKNYDTIYLDHVNKFTDECLIVLIRSIVAELPRWKIRGSRIYDLQQTYLDAATDQAAMRGLLSHIA